MKLTKKLETEVLQAYSTIWDAYLKGDMRVFASLLDDNCHIIGSAAGEIFTNKRSAVKYYKATAAQITGKAEFRNRKISVMPIGKDVMVNEQCDFYLLIDDQWTFYGDARVSSLFQKKNNKWKVIHQHGSFPDSKTEEGDQVNADKIKAENLQLRDAVKRRTIELEEKNKELQIEASLEKVRAQALAMHKPEDLLNVCKVLFKELLQLGFDQLRNTIIHTFYDEKDYFRDHDYSDLTGGAITIIPYSDQPIIKRFLGEIRKSDQAFSQMIVTGNELKEWKKFRKQGGQKDDPRLAKASALYYYVYSIGIGSIGISTFKAITEEQQQVLKQFRNVFDFAYRRYMDVANAEAQVREAKIEAALERVRSRSMGMHKSEELLEVIVVVSEQLHQLDIKFDNVSFGINNQDYDINLWMAAKGYPYSFRINFPYIDNPSVTHLKEALNKGLEFFADTLTHEQNKEWLLHIFNNNTGASIFSEQTKKYLLESAGYSRSIVIMKNIFLVIGNYAAIPYAEEENIIFKRFGNVFEQSYIRFLDLQKAEAQAKETQIELALERVRARTMGMQRSEELKEVIQVVYEQFVHLNINTEHTGFVMDYKVRDDRLIWVASKHGVPSQLTIPYFDSEYYNRFNEAKEKGWDFFATNLSFEEKNSFYQQLFMYIPELPDEAKEFYFNCPGLAISTVLLENVGLYIENFEGIPYSDEDNATLMRFGKVFQQTYTRFLDLQKAEAQAREAQIESGLERVRSRSLAMHNTFELQEVIHTVHKELLNLNIAIHGGSFIAINSEIERELRCWGSGGTADTSQEVHVPFYENPVYINLVNGIKNGPGFFTEEYTQQEKNEFFTFLLMHKPWSQLDAKQKKETLSSPGGYTRSCCVSQHTSVFIINHLGEKFSTVDNDILKRFGKVFEQSYTRFLDLQKAEAQAREAKIEASLEKIRARTMGMQQSHELGDVATVLFKELNQLVENLWSCGFVLCEKDRGEDEWWLSTGDGFIPAFYLPNTGDATHANIYDAWKKGETYHTEQLEGKALQEHYDWLMSIPVSKNIFDEMKAAGNSLPTWQKLHCAYFSYGYLVMITEVPCPEEQIFKRFAQVFDQTYTRFLDLQKAEAQAREAQIEASLERVRSSAMAMQTSEELNALIGTVFTELIKLDLVLTRCVIQIFDPVTNGAHWWMANSEAPDQPMNFFVKHHTLPFFNAYLAAWKERTIKWQYILEGQNKITTDDFLFTETELSQLPGFVIAGMRAPGRVYLNSSFNNFGNLTLASIEPLSDEHFDILLRFAKVFDLTYTRFNDLKQAEAQAREAKIEAAMEKVRARAMVMQKPDELVEVSELLRKEMGLLGVEELETSSIYIHNDVTGTTDCWYAIQDIRENGTTLVSDYMTINLNDTWVGGEMLKFYKSDQKQISILMQGENRKEWINYCADHSKILQGYYGNEIPKRTYHLLKFSNGYMGAASPGDISIESWDLLKRAATVFSLAYTRFGDLQTAEASAKAAVKQSALDRVRAEIASMRTTTDLEKITPLIWNELTILGIPFIRCGVFIMDDEQQLIHTFLSTPDGKAIAAFHLPYNTPGNIAQVLNHWYDKKNYIDHWDESAFTEFANILVKQGELASAEQYLKTIPHGGIYLHFLPFLQGMLYVGNVTQLGEEEIKLIQSVADAFSTAYARYEDFNKLEAAKQQVEKTLVDLKQAQTQLVQSEKMASLGELTAGIAHEIQNPLNFVNNFSEVSSELLAEMEEELAKGNYQDAIDIANDVKQNLEKINHHGKRADDIVKGMLQHSRTSSGQKELTDINILADEYLRLCYHGLRAKDKSFNAAIKTDFDEAIGKINIIPQDIGRVILNLLTNAFYAASLSAASRFSNSDKNDNPTVWVSTKKVDDKILISVRDNGPGIPQKVLDKIFQPFFTTKPTGQGTGLGLSLSYDIVKAHRGELIVETKEGVGTEFIIQLPI